MTKFQNLRLPVTGSDQLRLVHVYRAASHTKIFFFFSFFSISEIIELLHQTCLQRVKIAIGYHSVTYSFLLHLNYNRYLQWRCALTALPEE